MKKSIQIILLLSFIFFSLMALGQTEYRITEDGKYQYLSIQEEANMIYDESMGTYYKPITERTFYLETYREGYIPKHVTYAQFEKLSIDGQRALVNQPYRDIQCSFNNPSPECIAMEEKQKIETSERSKVVDLSPKCDEKSAKSKQANISWTTKLLMNPNDERLENIDCGEVSEQKSGSAQATDKKAPSTKKILLGVD